MRFLILFFFVACVKTVEQPVTGDRIFDNCMFSLRQNGSFTDLPEGIKECRETALALQKPCECEKETGMGGQ